MNYVQTLKEKIRDSIHACKTLEEYLAYLREQDEYTVTIDEAKNRVEIIRKILED